jgi:hypothetical protein
VTHQDDNEISWKIVGTLVEEFFAAHRAAIGHFEEAGEHVSAAAIRTASPQPPHHGLGRRDVGPAIVARRREEKRGQRGQRQRGHCGNPSLSFRRSRCFERPLSVMPSKR